MLKSCNVAWIWAECALTWILWYRPSWKVWIFGGVHIETK